MLFQTRFVLFSAVVSAILLAEVGVCLPVYAQAVAHGDAMTFIEWAIQHGELWIALGSALWTAASLVVALTPTTEDDQWMARLANRWSFLKPRNVPGRFSVPGKLERAPEVEIDDLVEDSSETEL